MKFSIITCSFNNPGLKAARALHSWILFDINVIVVVLLRLS
jgi:voltage-gated potassium channel Kch